MKKIGLFLVPLVVIPFLASCGGKTPDPEPVVIYHTVSFNTNGGSLISSQQVADGEVINKPADPSKIDYVFDGWYKYASLAEEYNFNNPVTSDITLYAKWQNEPKWIVTFESNGGEHRDAKRVRNGEKVNEPTAPTKEGYDFKGWYTTNPNPRPIEKDKYDFNSEVTSDITLYAYWIRTGANLYTFSLVGTNCTIFNDHKYTEKNIEQGSTFQFTIVPDAGFKAPLTIEVPEGSGCTSYENGTITITNINSNVRVIAVAPLIAHTVTFDPNGGRLDEGVPSTISEIESGAKFYDIKNVGKQTATHDDEHFEFIGWGLSPNTPDKISDDYKITNDLTVYAIYTNFASASITLTSDSNNCSIRYEEELYHIGETFLIPARKNVTMKIEVDEDYLPVFEENVTFSGASTASFDPKKGKQDIEINVAARAVCTITVKTIHKKDNLEAYSWKEISLLSQMGYATDYFKVRDTKNVTINGKTHIVRIIGLNKDKDPEGNDLGITFEFANVITDSSGICVGREWNTGGNNCDYRASTINKFLNDESDQNSIYNMLPSSSDDKNPDLRDVIRPVDKKVGVSTDGGQSYNPQPFESGKYPKLFLLAHDEICYKEGGEDVTIGEGSRYTYYASSYLDELRIKYLAESKETANWYWLRSPGTTATNRVWYVSAKGIINGGENPTGKVGGIAPTFCV